MGTLHFIYSIPRGSVLYRIADRVIEKTGITPYYRSYPQLLPWRHPIRSPHSISYNLLKKFQLKAARQPIKFYNIYERRAITLKPDDIVLGCPAPLDMFQYEGRSDTDNPELIFSRTVRENPGIGKKFLIMPYANDQMYSGWARGLVQHIDGIILVAGEIWTQDLVNTPLGDISAMRVLPRRMGIDVASYPRVKETFNQAGKRGYLYIGSCAWYKNIPQLEALAAAIPGFEGGHIGTGTVQGWKKIAEFSDLTADFMREIARDYDIFVSVSTADPTATTVLENMCFGFALAITPETGYTFPPIATLRMGDTKHNIAQLQKLQQASEEELQAHVQGNRAYVAQNHTWKDFADSVEHFIYSNENSQ